MTAYNQSFVFIEEFYQFHTKFFMFNFFGNYYFWTLIIIIVYEFVIKATLQYRVPSMKWRLKLGIVLGFLECVVMTIIIGLNRYSAVTYAIHKFWLEVGLSVIRSVVRVIVFVAGFELIIAQTPCSMRNFFMNVGYSVGLFSIILSRYIYILFNSECKSRNCPIIYSLVVLSLNFLTMPVLWINITRYRMRSRR